MLSRLVTAAAAVTFSAALAVPSPASTVATSAAAEPTSDNGVTQVIAISIDALKSQALTRLGPEGAPNLHALRDAGASTLNARTEYELTVTLPNNTGMVTGRRIDAARGGHGVTWNDDRRRPSTVHAAAGRRVGSVFTVVDDAGGSNALFASKSKFSLWRRTWGEDLDRTTIDLDNASLVRALLADLDSGFRTFRFLHLSQPDDVGHERGFMSPAYLRAVRRVDRMVGEVVTAVRSDAALSGSVAIILTSDHGGAGERSHSDPTSLANYRVPFMVLGPGVDAGSDLYELNPDYGDPGRARTWYGVDRQPVRNGMLANLALDLLDLEPVPGSEHNRAQDLDLSTSTEVAVPTS